MDWSMILVDVFVISLVYVVVHAFDWLRVYKKNGTHYSVTGSSHWSRFIRLSIVLCYVVCPVYFLLTRDVFADGMVHMFYGIFGIHAVLFQINATFGLIDSIKNRNVVDGVE